MSLLPLLERERKERETLVHIITVGIIISSDLRCCDRRPNSKVPSSWRNSPRRSRLAERPSESQNVAKLFVRATDVVGERQTRRPPGSGDRQRRRSSQGLLDKVRLFEWRYKSDRIHF